LGKGETWTPLVNTPEFSIGLTVVGGLPERASKLKRVIFGGLSEGIVYFFVLFLFVIRGITLTCQNTFFDSPMAPEICKEKGFDIALIRLAETSEVILYDPYHVGVAPRHFFDNDETPGIAVELDAEFTIEGFEVPDEYAVRDGRYPLILGGCIGRTVDWVGHKGPSPWIQK